MLTVNLLPENIKKDLNQKIFLATFKNITGLIFAAILFIGSILLWAKVISTNNFNNAIEQSTLLAKEYGGVNQEIRQTNEFITSVYKIQKDYIIWSDAVKQILDIIPSEVIVNYLSLSEPGGVVSIKGAAATRDGLLDFKNNLESSPLFTRVEIPISYFLSRENINFEINLTTKKGVFK